MTFQIMSLKWFLTVIFHFYNYLILVYQVQISISVPLVAIITEHTRNI